MLINPRDAAATQAGPVALVAAVVIVGKIGDRHGRRAGAGHAGARGAAGRAEPGAGRRVLVRAGAPRRGSGRDSGEPVRPDPGDRAGDDRADPVAAARRAGRCCAVLRAAAGRGPRFVDPVERRPRWTGLAGPRRDLRLRSRGGGAGRRAGGAGPALSGHRVQPAGRARNCARAGVAGRCTATRPTRPCWSTPTSTGRAAGRAGAGCPRPRKWRRATRAPCSPTSTSSPAPQNAGRSSELRRAGASEVVQPEFEAGVEVLRHTLRRYGITEPRLGDLAEERRSGFYHSMAASGAE